MFLGILKFQVEADGGSQEGWNRDAHSLCEKLRARFKVLAKSFDDGSGEQALAVVQLARDEASLSQLFTKILAFCETSGIGRVNAELELIEPLEAFFDSEDDEEDDDA